MNENLRIAIFGIATPAAIACIGSGLCERFLLRSSDSQPHGVRRRLLAAVVACALFGVAIAIGFAGIAGSWKAGWANMDARLQLMTVISGVAAVLAAAWMVRTDRSSTPSSIPMILTAVLVSVLGGAIVAGSGLWNGSAGTLSSFTSALGGRGLLVTILTIVACVTWAALVSTLIALLRGRERSFDVSILMLGMAAAVAATLLGTGSVVLGQYGFVVTAVTTGWAAASLFWREWQRSAGVPVIIVGQLTALLVCGVVFSETPLWAVGVLGLALPAGYLADLMLTRRKKPWVRSIVLVSVTALIAAAAFAPGIVELVKFVLGGAGDDPYASYR